MSGYHELKTWPQWFAPIAEGRKHFEIRENDRDFQVGDVLRLLEFNPGEDCYTGRSLFVVVDFILHWQSYPGLKRGYAVLSIRRLVPEVLI